MGTKQRRKSIQEIGFLFVFYLNFFKKLLLLSSDENATRQ